MPTDRGCNTDLGPRWMLVLDQGSRSTAVVVDDFGCEDVRLTVGTVSGVLAGPPQLVGQLRAAGGAP